MDFNELMEYQNMIKNRLRSEQNMDRKIEFLTIINHLTVGPKNLVQKEQVIIEAESQGFNEEEVEEMINKLKEDNIIYEPSPGYIKKR